MAILFPSYWSPHLVVSQITTHQGVVGKTLHGHEVTLPGDPCPWCRNSEYKLKEGFKICSSCHLNNYDAKYRLKTRARRDSNGSLLCMTCLEAFPYAEVDENQCFRCYKCKSNDRIE